MQDAKLGDSTIAASDPKQIIAEAIMTPGQRAARTTRDMPLWLLRGIVALAEQHFNFLAVPARAAKEAA